MPDYLVKFTGHIRYDSRLTGLPATVHYDMIVTGVNASELKDHTNTQATQFIRQNGMVVLKNPNETLSIKDDGSDLFFDKRIFVPMSSISYISTVTVELTSPIPQAGDEVQLQ